MIVRRPRYAPGMVLGADDLEALAAYLDGRERALTRALHGTGVVRGLGVTTDPVAGTVTVTPGAAVDPGGRLIELDTPVTVPAGTGGTVVLGVTERLVDPYPTPHGTEYRTVERVPVVSVVTTPGPAQVPLGPVGPGGRRPAPIARRVRLTAGESSGLRSRAARRFC